VIKLGLLGQSLSHTLSPVIHQSFFEELGLTGRYDKIEVAEAADVAARLTELADEGYSGLNVTIPYKLTVLPLLGALAESAELASAVNTIQFGGGLTESTGHNTDSGGLAEALSRLEAIDSDRRVLILGNGGAARAAIIAVSALGFRGLTVAGRDQQKALSMLDQLGSSAERASLVQNCRSAKTIAVLDKVAAEQAFAGDQPLENIGLVINATPIGQKDDNVPAALGALFTSLRQRVETVAFVDLVYGKAMTPLCRIAEQAGFKCVEDGKEMLINQARLAFKIWTGELPTGALARKRLSD
jgi:shikimate dehydrogenase